MLTFPKEKQTHKEREGDAQGRARKTAKPLFSWRPFKIRTSNCLWKQTSGRSELSGRIVLWNIFLAKHGNKLDQTYRPYNLSQIKQIGLKSRSVKIGCLAEHILWILLLAAASRFENSAKLAFKWALRCFKLRLKAYLPFFSICLNKSLKRRLKSFLVMSFTPALKRTSVLHWVKEISQLSEDNVKLVFAHCWTN